MTATEMGMSRGHATSGSADGGLTSSSLGIGSMSGRTPPTTPKKVGGKMLAVKILMLDDAYTLFQIQNKALGAVLLEQVCRQLNLLESDYFGLEYTDGNTRYWLDLDKPMNRQVCLSQVEPVLRFCVKFYTPDPAQLEEEYTRYLFALQIKRDLAHGELLCSENTAALMASYIVQAECGDYVEEDYPDHRYLSIFKFFPTQDDEIERRIMENHKKHIGMTPAAADLNLLETARRCEYYGIKMHPAKDHENVLLNLAAAHMGILVFQNYTKINTFSWAKIRKISFKRKRFLIKLHPEGYGYYKDVVEFFFDGRNECKNFWKKCVEHHGFFRCSTVKKLPRQKTRVLSRGSSFRYSGRTQKQVQDFVRDNYIKRQPFQRKSCFTRSQSFRHSPSIHPNVSNVGMSVSAQPLIPLRDNQCVGTPVSLSCGSMTFASTGDTHSPGSPMQHETGYDHHDFETPSLTPSRQDTLSPETSLTSSPHRGHDANFTGQHLGSKSNRGSNHHFHRAPSLDTNSIASSRHHISSHTLHSILVETPIKEYNSYLEDSFVEPEDDSGDNLSHDSYDLIEKELDCPVSWKGSKGDSISGSQNILSSIGMVGSGEGLEWCESKGGVDMGSRESRPTSHTGSLPRSHGSNTSGKQTNGYTGSLPRTHSVSQSSNLSRSLAGSRASSRITLEIPIDARPIKSDDEELSSPGSPEFHENSVCEITSEKGYLRTSMQLGSVTITDNSGGSVFSLLKSARRAVIDDSLTDAPSSNLRSRSRSTRDSQETLKDPGDISVSVCTMSSRVSASVRAAKQVGQYVDYGSSQESLHKMSSCESDGGSSLSSHTRSSTTPRPIEFHSAKFLPTRRSTSTSPPSITSGSSQLTGPTVPSRPHSMDFSAFNKKSMFHVYGVGRGSDSGGNTDSDICSPLEIPHPLPQPERVQEVDEEEEDEEATPLQEDVQFLPPPPDLGLITRIRGSSDEEEEEERIEYEDEKPNYETERESFEEEEEEELMRPRHEEIVIPHALDPFSDDLLDFNEPSVDEQILVVIDDRQSPFSYDFECLPPPEVKEESPSSGEIDLSVTDTTTSRERKIDESDASERTVIERFRLPDDRLNKLGSKDSQMSIEEIDEGILDRRSSVGNDRKGSVQSQDVGRKSPFVMERRPSYHDLEYFMPQSPRDRCPSHDGDRRSPFLDTERRSSHSSVQDVGRRSPYEKERKYSSSSDRHSSVSSSRRGSSSSDRRGSNSSDRPSLSDIGRRTSISYEPGQRSPFYETPVFEFAPEAIPDPFGPDTSMPLVSNAAMLEKDRRPGYFDGIVLQDRMLVNEYTESFIPPDGNFISAPPDFSGAHVVEILEGSPEEDVFEEEKKHEIEVINVEQDDEQLEVEILQYKHKSSSPKRNHTYPTKITIEPASFDDTHEDLKRITGIREDLDKSPENVNADLSDDVFLTEKDNSFAIDLSLDTSGLGPKDSVSSMVSPLPIEEKEAELIKKEEMLCAIGGDSAEDEDLDHDDFYDDDEEDDHAQMSDHSSQSPDLGSEPDEYHDDYQEPEYFQHFNNRQIDVGFAFPSRTLSRISERSTTSEQEHEQDHLALHEAEPEQSDTSKASTPTEEKPSSLQSEEQQGQSDISSASDETHETLVEEKDLLTPTAATSTPAVTTELSLEEKQNANQFATQLFLRDLPDFVGDDSDDEFPSPPSSAFLENPHTELSQIETYYVEMNQRSKDGIVCTEEGIYDNIPGKFEGIHEVSESESASEDNHTLHEQPPDAEAEGEEQIVEEIEIDEDAKPLCSSVHKVEASPSPPPPPPPPRMLTRVASMARSPTPPLTPPTPITSSIESPENVDAHVQYFSCAIHEEIVESDSPSVSSSLSPQVEKVDWVNI